MTIKYLTRNSSLPQHQRQTDQQLEEQLEQQRCQLLQSCRQLELPWSSELHHPDQWKIMMKMTSTTTWPMLWMTLILDGAWGEDATIQLKFEQSIMMKNNFSD